MHFRVHLSYFFPYEGVHSLTKQKFSLIAKKSIQFPSLVTCSLKDPSLVIAVQTTANKYLN